LLVGSKYGAKAFQDNPHLDLCLVLVQWARSSGDPLALLEQEWGFKKVSGRIIELLKVKLAVFKLIQYRLIRADIKPLI